MGDLLPVLYFMWSLKRGAVAGPNPWMAAGLAGHPQVHAAHHSALQHQFQTLSQQKEAATLGMWAFLLTEILFLGGLFIAYLLYRT